MAYTGVQDASQTANFVNGVQTSGVAQPLSSPISSDNLASNTPIQLPTPTPTNYSNVLNSGNAIIAGNAPALTGNITTPNGAIVNATTGEVVTPPPTENNSPTSTSTVSPWYSIDGIKSLIGLQPKPASAADQYKTDYANSGIDTAQADYNTKAAAVKTAQNEYNGLDAQIKALDYQSGTVIPTQDQQDATGRGITAAGLAPITAAEQRTVLLQKAHLQFQALLAQSKIAAAQGDAQLSQSILQQAQDHLDKVFQLHQTDATNQYNYQTNLIDKVMAYADKAETAKLNAQKDTLTENNSQYNNFVNDVRTASTSATTSGQGKIATDLANLVANLNPNSKTFTSDYQQAQKDFATLQGKIVAKPTSEQITTSAISNINSQLKGAVGSDGYTDPNLYARLRSTSSLSASDFDNRFAYLVNPESRAKLGLTSAQAGNTPIPGNFTPTQTQSLIGSGIPSSKLDSLSSYIAQYGLQAALTNSDMTDAQKIALKAVYGQ